MCIRCMDAILVAYKNRLRTFLFVTASKCRLLVHPDFTFVTLYTKPPRMGGYIILPSQQSAPNSVFELSRHFGTSIQCLKLTKNAFCKVLVRCKVESSLF